MPPATRAAEPVCHRQPVCPAGAGSTSPRFDAAMRRGLLLVLLLAIVGVAVLAVTEAERRMRSRARVVMSRRMRQRGAPADMAKVQSS